MRSIPLGLPLPRIERPARRIRPQSSGFARRVYVRARLGLLRSAGIGMGAREVRRPRDLFRLCAAAVLRGGRLGRKAMAIAAKGAAWPVVRAGRLAAAAAVPVGDAALRVAAWAGEVAERHRKREIGRLAPVLLMLALTSAIFATGYFGLALEVSLDGQPLGFVTSREEIGRIVREVEARASEYLGAPCVLTPNITYNLRYLESDNMLDAEALKSTLFTSVSGAGSSWYVLKVDGMVLGGSASKITLQNLLSRVKDSQSFSEQAMRTEFVQDVRIEPIGQSAVPMGNLSEIESLLTSNSIEVQTYAIQSGDTLTKVAKKHGMSVGEITSMNPGLNPDRLSIGQEVMISAAVPYISLRQMRTEAYEEAIPFETVIEYSDSMYTNQSKVVKDGVPGLASVVADVVYIDGVVSDREVLQYTVLRAAEAQVKRVGTQKPPPKSATGSFIKPSNGVFTSGFGYRKNLGDHHTGIDFAGKVGTAIWAADGGTVTFAGWKGNYGNCVIIDHGNGFKTLYAHCSTLLVKKGQQVAKGENIAKVGNTGRSTGPHVHLEIIVNGKQVNPLNYITK